ncbi:MAG: LytTR family DNA-binding domain-containing protein [Dysgonamonadaceae bacterium]|jgi:DNA-binding LytR/AlgR family response regulator|nr:LytTR family DNA-binding domain-containing protein [Dysgonamonadaceae bacterium]
MKCIAIDDEPLALSILNYYCGQVPSIRLLGVYTDPLDSLSYIRSMQPDLLFLDIRMPEFSGIDIVNALEKNALVIFTTAHREYAIEGFELNVVDYLLKPFSFDRFLTAYTKAEERFQMSQKKTIRELPDIDETLMFKCSYQNIQLPLSEILYIEAFDNYVKIVTQNRTYMPVMTMKSLLNLLPKSKFVRVHKSLIIPFARIKSFNHEFVVTETIQAPVGRTFQKDFLEKMDALKARG